jgi:hypothetical protein
MASLSEPFPDGFDAGHFSGVQIQKPQTALPEGFQV